MDASDVTTQAILAAYEKLPPADRRQVDELVEAISAAVKQRSAEHKGLGKQSAIELIGKVGLLLAESCPQVKPAQAATAVQKGSPSQPKRRGTKHV
jgi:hypothetical protein